MMETIGVRFKKVGKMYPFLPNNFTVVKGDRVIVETTRGIELGEVVKELSVNHSEKAEQPPKKILRLVTEEDLKMLEENKKKEAEALEVCAEKISRLKLDMKLVNVELTFDRNKMIFYFTSDNRVDFRELVKELASVFRTRIELRQIGVRDEAKMLNGIGMCGRSLCCATFLGDFQPVSIKMAKEQNLSLNPTKISGICGRLMCCLKYEEEVYEELNKTMPNVGDFVETPDGNGEVISTHVLLQQVKVLSKGDNDTSVIGFYNSEEIKVLKVRKKRSDGEGYKKNNYQNNDRNHERNNDRNHERNNDRNHERSNDRKPDRKNDNKGENKNHKTYQNNKNTSNSKYDKKDRYNKNEKNDKYEKHDKHEKFDKKNMKNNGKKYEK